MNKKKLLALPVVCVAVAMIGASVMAAGSAAKGIKVTDASGNDITANYEVSDTSFEGPVLSEIDGIEDEVKAVNKEAKLADAELVFKGEITENVSTSGTKTVTFTAVEQKSGDVFIVVHGGAHTHYVVSADPSIECDSFSPFLVYRIAVSSSAQTGEYAAHYVVMIASALVACGAVFAIRAKKAVK